MKTRTSMVAFALLALGCSSHALRPSAPPLPGDPHGVLCFRVFASTPEDRVAIQDWPSIPVYLVSASGRTLVGKTDSRGAIRIPKDSIWVQGAFALLFCRDSTDVECTALTVDTEFLRGFDEFYVQLPRGMLVN